MTRMLLATRPNPMRPSTHSRKPQLGSQRAAPATSARAQVLTASGAGGGVWSLCHGETPRRITLPVGATNQKLEQEAERTADKAMRLRDGKAEGTTPLTAPGKLNSGLYTARFAFPNHSPLIQRQEMGKGLGHQTVPALASQILGHEIPGRPLPETTRVEMESYFGVDFSGVHIHTDSHAARVSRALHAQALTIGNDIFFDRAKYAPGSAAGGRLLAHELSHIVQQQRGEVSPNAIQRAHAEPAAIKPVPEPPVDCTVEITQNRTCRDLIAEMISLQFEIAENDKYIKPYEDGETPPDMDLHIERLRRKGELQNLYRNKERIRVACCPDLEVPPLVQPAASEPQASAVAPSASPEPKAP